MKIISFLFKQSLSKSERPYYQQGEIIMKMTKERYEEIIDTQNVCDLPDAEIREFCTYRSQVIMDPREFQEQFKSYAPIVELREKFSKTPHTAISAVEGIDTE